MGHAPAWVSHCLCNVIIAYQVKSFEHCNRRFVAAGHDRRGSLLHDAACCGH